MTRKEKVNQLFKYQAKMPMPKEYISMLGEYTKMIYKWIPYINKMYFYITKDGDGEIKGNVTPRCFKLMYDLKPYVENICEIRMYMIGLSSMIMLVGFNYPSNVALNKFKKLLDILEGAMLDNFVIISRYKKAINNHTKLNLKNCKTPITMEELIKSDDWVDTDVFRGFTEHGIKLMDLNFQK